MKHGRYRLRQGSPAGQIFRVVVMVAVIVVAYRVFFRSEKSKSPPIVPSPSGSSAQPQQGQAPGPDPGIAARLLPPAEIEARDGIAAAILVDTSGSMSGAVPDARGNSKQKIEIARASALELVRITEQFARDHPDRPVLLGIYEFSDRGTNELSRSVVPLGAPSVAAAQPLIARMTASGGTPIGEAIVAAKKDL